MPTLKLPGGPVNAKAIVFDKDGVLLDFVSYWGAITRARATATIKGIDCDTAKIQELEALLGLRNGDVDPNGPLVLATRTESAVLATGFLYQYGVPWVEAKSRVREAWKVADEQLPPGSVQPCRQVKQTLEALRSAGWLLGVATTDNKTHAWATLRAIGVATFLTAVAGGDEVVNGKPAPELLLLACERLGASPDETIMVGDGVNDLLMGRQAGCVATVGVLSGVSTREQLEPAADVILPDIAELLPTRS
ncbi:MAG: HAD family hydrolase [Cyanobacteria bacterium NC_groundwater_1444_Ag_S-0.65um_54_12]|nr:HAD family hydrolase [Cyanobacteria bacterium NC_groundwater_1444_Ag_S-0.65um_54_12]